MLTPEKTHPAMTLTEEVTHAINERLHVKKKSKKWLAYQMNTDYGRIKRILNINDSQQLSLDEANEILILLDSSLRDVLTAPVVETLHADISNSLSKYQIAWRP